VSGAQSTYRAVQVTKPGEFELVQRLLAEPPPGRVRIRIEACGICHSDVLTVGGVFPGIAYPRVPGHEVVGRIEALGKDVSGWMVGQRVGVGFLGGPCFHCEPCRRGDYVNCQNQAIVGVHYDGGYAESMIAEAHGLVAIPDSLESTEAAPLLCAGVTTFNALRRSPARPGDLVAILGIGGLGHLGIQFARRMGFRVAAIARGVEKQELAEKLGAHHYIDSEVGDPAAVLKALGGASVILATASNGKAMSRLFGGLKFRGRMTVVGASADPISISTPDLLFGTRGIEGALTGSSIDCEDTLSFSSLEDIRAMIETVPLEEAPAAYTRMMANRARFRMVLVTGH
jgi:alcohol dehydrogenase, propanol-preferring